MTDEEIKADAKLKEAYNKGFYDGQEAGARDYAEWLNTPTEETIKKVINDFMAIYGKRDGGYEGIDNAVERIKEHWNDE